MTVYAWSNPDGSCSICYPLSKNWTKAVPIGATIIELESDALPQSRYFRNAWEIGEAKVRVNMSKARAIKLAEIRRERNAKLDALDKEYMKALTTKGDTKAIADKMQALRDIPQTTDLSVATTPEELEAIQPAWPEE